jgi:hypothetical protein
MFRFSLFSYSHQAEIQALFHAIHIHQNQMRMILVYPLEIQEDRIKLRGGDCPALEMALLMVNL